MEARDSGIITDKLIIQLWLSRILLLDVKNHSQVVDPLSEDRLDERLAERSLLVLAMRDFLDHIGGG